MNADESLMGGRVDALERRLVQWRLFALLGPLVCVALTLMGAKPKDTVPREIRAQAFVLMDESGNERGHLGINPTGTAALMLLGTDGAIQIDAPLRGNAHIAIRSGSGNDQIVRFMATPSGVVLDDVNGTMRFSVGVLPELGTNLTIADSQGTDRISLGVTADGLLLRQGLTGR